MRQTATKTTIASLVTLVAMLSLFTPSALAETLTWARAGDSLTLDPHAQNEGPTHTLAHQIYEPLIIRDMTGKIVPALATSWAPSASKPRSWVFHLRKGVSYHDGSAFDSEDVVFSIKRALNPNSDMKELLNSVEDIRAIDKYTIEITTKGPNPLLPNNLTNLFIMDKTWAEKNNVVEVKNHNEGEESFATRNANGTGPYKLVSREPDVKTVLTAFGNYWGKNDFPLAVTDVVFTPIQNNATRLAALLSREVHFIQDVPVQDLARVQSTNGIKLISAPQNRVIFFGMNQGDNDLESDNISGKNPLADVRVRRAINIAIDRDAIKKIVMREQSDPTGVITPPFVNGWTPELDQYPKHDIAQAKKLMSDAGYDNGFSIRLNCPNDRYINDEAICQAAVGMLAKIAIIVNLDAKPKAQHFPLITGHKTDFYMLGWGVPTYDSEYIFNFLVHTKGESIGTWNGVRYSNPTLDKKIKTIASMTDIPQRNRVIDEIWQTIRKDRLYIPIHNQILNWAIADKYNTIVDPEDQPKFKYFTKN